jgi:phage/plasmid-like protein (TIGR03299 family)
MAHQIDNSKGFPAFTAVGKPAWHNLGTIVNTLSPADALRLGGLDFNVLVSPNVHRYPYIPNLNPEQENFPAFPEVCSKTSFFSWRDDTGGILGDKIGAYYTPLQNLEALNVISPLCDMGIQIETAGSLWGGRIVFVLLNMGEYKVAGTDAVRTYLLYTNAHDGSGAVKALFTDTRVVCWNTLSAAVFGAVNVVKIRHTVTVQERTEQALQLMVLGEKHKEKAHQGFDRLVDTKFSEKRFFDYVAAVFLDKGERQKIAAGDPSAISTRKKGLLGSFFEYAQFGPGQTEFKGTAWNAYNAVTGYLGNVANYKDENTRMFSLMFGAAEKVNAKALELATFPDRIEPLSVTASPDAFLN